MSKQEILEGYTDDATWEDALDHMHGQAWEEHLKARFEKFLIENQALDNVSVRDRHADFYIGGIDVYPDRFNDDHMNVIGRSSVAFHQHGVQATAERRFVTEVNVHLPPAPEGLKQRIKTVLDTNSIDGIGVYWGSGALGGMPAPDGTVTPHIVHTEDVTFETCREAIERAVRAYEHVYENGAHALKRQP